MLKKVRAILLFVAFLSAFISAMFMAAVVPPVELAIFINGLSNLLICFCLALDRPR